MVKPPSEKPKRRLKPKINRSDPAQSERFIEAARKAGMDETGETFEAAFKKIVPPPRRGKRPEEE
jgi:hypothetical protein